MKKLICFILVLFLGTLSAATTGDLNFSGEWQLNTDKSEFGEGRGGSRMAATKLVIDHQKVLKIARHAVNRNDEPVTTEELLTLDGKECVNQTTRGERLSKAKFSADGKTLQIESKTTFQGRNGVFKMDSEETWSLQDNGKVLVIDQTMTTPRGERTRKFYYDKVLAEKK